MKFRKEPLTDDENALLTLLFAAHDESARRDNASTVAMLHAGVGSGRYMNGIAAALLSIGGVHAPLAESMALLAADDPTGEAKRLMNAGFKVPGWGNSFHRGKPDPAWVPLDDLLWKLFPDYADRIAGITKMLHKAGKNVFPNPSIYTAATALIIGLSPVFAPYLFVRGRLDAWSEILGGIW